MMNKNVRILVSTHKPYFFPDEAQLYTPIQLGVDEVKERFGFQGDNTGINISKVHRYYSDLSAVYWGWKNLDNDYIGFCHYRRYFVNHFNKFEHRKAFRYILSQQELNKLLADFDVIVPKKRHYFIETAKEHYSHTHNPKDLETARLIISEIFPEYLPYFDKAINCKSIHMFNTFIMSRQKLDSYCSFIFPVLFELQKRVNFTNYNVYESRVCGYIAEFLLDTWILKNDISYKEVKLKFIEKQDWIKKIYKFLLTKYIRNTRTFKEN